MSEDQAIEDFLARTFPHLRVSWLRRINEKLGALKKENGGYAEMRVRWNKGRDQWTEWNQRDLSPQD